MRIGRPRRVKVADDVGEGAGDTGSESADALGAERCGAG
jgi:hypothetical protein